MRLPVFPIIFAAAMVAHGAGASEVPGVFEVVNIASGEHLNMRAAPSPVARDLGDLGPGERVEVTRLSPDGAWAEIAAGEQGAWVARRFLAPVPIPTFANTRAPDGLLCTGAEPFWSLALADEVGLIFARPDIAPVEAMLIEERTMTAEGRAAFPVHLMGRGPGVEIRSMLQPALCSDGMSDRPYGWSVGVTVESVDGFEVLSGCCRLEGQR